MTLLDLLATDDGRAFIAAVKAAPGDDLPRLVMCDWLNGQGSTEADSWAEFIRVDCEYAAYEFDPCGWSVAEGKTAEDVHVDFRCECAGCNLRHRRDSILSEFAGAWTGNLVGRCNLLVTWRRGFIDSVACHYSAWDCEVYGVPLCPLIVNPSVTLLSRPRMNNLDWPGDSLRTLLADTWPEVREWILPPVQTGQLYVNRGTHAAPNWESLNAAFAVAGQQLREFSQAAADAMFAAGQQAAMTRERAVMDAFIGDAYRQVGGFAARADSLERSRRRRVTANPLTNFARRLPVRKKGKP